jgi:hypothetical protein
MNKKENWLRLIHDDSPGWIGPPWEAFKGNSFGDIFVGDPITQSMFPRGPVYDTPQKDPWGVTFLWLSGAVARHPHITAGNKVVSDVRRWRESVVFPPLDGYDWSSAREFAASVDRSRYLTVCWSSAGVFERSHFLMGFEDALCAYLEEPEVMHDLAGAIADWKIGHLERTIDNLHPDVVLYHDDWGCKSSLFLPPDVWRRIIKPHQRRIVGAVKSRGVIFMHHADCVCEPIVEDMAEMGVDIWQGVIPQNDIPTIQRRLAGWMALIGGIDAPLIDRPECDEGAIRSEVRRCIDTYCPAGRFVPCITSILPLFPGVARVYHDELSACGRDYFH